MKNNVLLICLALVLVSCQAIPVLQPTSTPVSPTPTNTPIPTFTPIPPTHTSTSTPSPSPVPTLSPDTNEQSDYLIYIATELGPSTTSNPQLTLYDPVNNKTQVLSPNLVSNSFSLSKDNRLAFEKDGGIHIWDYPFIEDTQTEVAFDGSPTTEKRVLSWSPDGHYLLLTGVQEGEKKLFLWDEKNVLDIYNYQGVISYSTKWSNNGNLAFTEFFISYDVYNTPRVSDFGEIFIWDGKGIVKVSQTLSRSPVWSKDGQLAFLSYQNHGGYTISIWDGKSKNNGVPDVKTLNAPDLEFDINSYPTWTNSGSIVFTGRSKTDSHFQIYEWNGKTTRNISQTQSHDNYGLAWRSDGYWSTEDDLTVYVYDNANQTVFETRGDNSRWAQSGLLFFCRPNGVNWSLSIWNGKNIVDVAHGDYVFAKWANSNGILCTYG